MRMEWSLRTLVSACFLWAGVLHTQIPIFDFQFSILHAQTFTEHLTRTVAGEGSVILHHDSDIEALVNGQITYAGYAPASRPQTPAISATAAHTDSLLAGVSSTTDQLPVFGRRMRATGYRVQVYAGGNNRQSKAEAYRMAGIVRSTFSDVSVYTNFISPRWTCRVGDFKTREEAAEMLHRMRETQKFREASIVKSQIVVIY